MFICVAIGKNSNLILLNIIQLILYNKLFKIIFLMFIYHYLKIRDNFHKLFFHQFYKLIQVIPLIHFQKIVDSKIVFIFVNNVQKAPFI